MKTLYLLRHAHTTSATPTLMGDHERILSPQGTEDAQSVGRYMQAGKMYPDFVLSSSSVRTIQTSRLIFGTLFSKEGVKVESHFDRKLYLASAEKLLSEIQSIDNSIDKLMLVAHNPGVSDLAVTLSKNKNNTELSNYAPATLCVFKAYCDNWADFSPQTVKLEKVFVPKGQ